MTEPVATIETPIPHIDDEPAAEAGQLPLPGTEAPSITLPELAALMEAFLLVTTEAPTVDDLAKGAGVEPDQIVAALDLLNANPSRGWVVQRHGRKVQLATAPRFAERVRTFLGLDRESRLSSAALETLAIVAYQQPVTRAEIDAVRGVDSSGVLATLHARELIEPVARLQTVGNPIQYGTTSSFLQHFGLRSLADLPPLGQIDGKDARTALDAAAAAGRPAPDESREPGDDAPTPSETDAPEDAS
ncbi:MAG: SMC-Scp complex subunit ScpB [Thermomicrobiales bacterium]